MMTKQDFQDWQQFDAVMSNFDNTIKQDIAAKLKETPNSYAQYSGWNFCGYVYWKEDTYHCDVWCYNRYAKTVHGTLEEIMRDVSEAYGYE